MMSMNGSRLGSRPNKWYHNPLNFHQKDGRANSHTTLGSRSSQTGRTRRFKWRCSQALWITRNLAHFLLRSDWLKSDVPIATPQSSSAVKARAAAPHRSTVSPCFTEAKQAISLGQFQLRFGPFNQAAFSEGPNPNLLLTRLKTLRQARLWPRSRGQSPDLLGTYPHNTEAHLALNFIQLLHGQWLERRRAREWR